MRRNNLLVFDDQLATNTPTFTPTELNHKLGAFDQLAVMAIVDNLNGHTDGFDIWVAHSADARLWLYRQNSSTTRPGSGDIHWASAGGLDETKTNVLAYLDGGATPLLAFVRLEMNFSGNTTKGHVRIYVTQRDQGG